jgi:hypothetical protein
MKTQNFQEVKMFLIRHDERLRIFSGNNDWTSHINDFKEYLTEVDAYSDINMHGLTDCSVVPVKVWVADLFAAGRVGLR